MLKGQSPSHGAWHPCPPFSCCLWRRVFFFNAPLAPMSFVRTHFDAIMTGLGYKRLPNGEWSKEDLDQLGLDVKKRGLVWAYKASGFVTE